MWEQERSDRTAALGNGGHFLRCFPLRDESGGTSLIGVVVMLGMWFIVGIAGNGGSQRRRRSAGHESAAAVRGDGMFAVG